MKFMLFTPNLILLTHSSKDVGEHLLYVRIRENIEIKRHCGEHMAEDYRKCFLLLGVCQIQISQLIESSEV
jgi:hypothetical protein